MEGVTAGQAGEADTAAVAAGSLYEDGTAAAGEQQQEQQEPQQLQDAEQQQQQTDAGAGARSSADERHQPHAANLQQQQDATDDSLPQQQQEQQQQEEQHQDEGDAQRGGLDGSSTRRSTSVTRGETSDNQSRKLFVGGLSRMTTTDSLRTYFQQYGEVEDSEVLFDKLTGRSRGFGFITFTSVEPVARVADVRHTVDGTQVEVRRAIPREEARDQGGSSSDREAGRLFVGGISDDVTDETLRTYFRHYGEIQSANAMFDRQNNRPRGFAFVIFRNPEDAEKAIGPHKKLGVHCEAKRAQPRQLNRAGGGAGGGGWAMGGAGGGMAGGGYGGYGGGGYPPRRDGGYGRGVGGRDYDSFAPGGGMDIPGYGIGSAASMYGPGGYGGYAANYNPYYAAYYAPHYNPYHAAYYAKMAAYSAMGGYGGYGAATGGYGEDGYSGGGGVDRGGRLANRSTPY